MNLHNFTQILLSLICLVTLNEAATGKQMTLRGRVIFPNDQRLSIGPNARLIVELQDTSMIDAPARIIGRYIGKAIRFPMAFAIKYDPSRVTRGLSYSLHAAIRDKANALLFINDVHISVTPIGANRTKFIDVSVIQVKRETTTKNPQRTQWPELVGMNGDQAVRIIKKETGFTNVMTVKTGSAITLDYRTDRVRVFVDANGIVDSVPTIG